MVRYRRAVAPLFGLCALGVIAGCGSTATEISETPSLTENAQTIDAATPSDDDVTTEATETIDERSPLTDLFTGGYTADELVERIREESRLRNEETQRCALQAGFEYKAGPPIEVPPEALGLNASDFSMPKINADGDYNAIGAFDDADWVVDRVLTPWSTQEDPNADYLKTLDETAQQIYFKTVAACREQALQEINLQDEIPTEISELADEMFFALHADPEVQAILRGWSECMSAASHDYQSANGIVLQLQQELDLILRGTTTFRDGTDESEFASMMAEDSAAAISFFRKNYLVDAEAIETLVAKEKAIATADASCRGDMEQTLRSIEVRYENDLIGRNEGLILGYLETRDSTD